MGYREPARGHEAVDALEWLGVALVIGGPEDQRRENHRSAQGFRKPLRVRAAAAVGWDGGGSYDGGSERNGKAYHAVRGGRTLSPFYYYYRKNAQCGEYAYGSSKAREVLPYSFVPTALSGSTAPSVIS